MASATITQPKVVSQEQWVEARKAFLVKEKAVMKQMDALRAERMELPWVKVTKDYEFDSTSGKKTLSDLFDGRSQLIVQHFMFGPGWEEGCPGCSFGADNVSGSLVHVTNHDVNYVAVSRATMAEIEPFHKRMGWNFEWVSSSANDFNFDFNVSFTKEQMAAGKGVYNYEETKISSEEMPGVSVFYKNEAGEIFHTYSTFGRGTEVSDSAYGLLDMTPKGRNEPKNGNLGDWVKHHDKYEGGAAHGCCGEKK